MATQNSSNNKFTNLADGFDIAGGTTARKLTLGGADVAIAGSGTAVITFPATSQTLASLAGTEALTNKTVNGWTFTAATITFTGTTGQTYTLPTTTATLARTDAANTFTGVQTMTSPATTTSITTASTSFTAWAGATTLLTIGGTGASASLHAPSTLDTTSNVTGAIRTSGGISAAKGLFIGGAVYHTPSTCSATSEGVAIPITQANCEITTDGDSDEDNGTLVNGAYVGQILNVYVKVVGNASDSFKITPTTLLGGTKISFAANPIGKGCTLVWTSAGWCCCGTNGGVVS